MRALRWTLLAIATNTFWMGVGMGLGATLGVLHTTIGPAVAAVLVFGAALAWAGTRIGPVAGFCIAMCAVASTVGAAIEVRKAIVVQAGNIVAYPSIETRPPPARAWLLRAEPVRYLTGAAQRLRGRTESGFSPRGVARHSSSEVYVVPLVAGRAGTVVGYDCMERGELHGDGGPFLLALRAWAIRDEDLCATAMHAAQQAARAAGHPIAPHAAQTMLRAFGSAAELRAEHALGEGLRVIGGLWSLFTVGAIAAGRSASRPRTTSA